MNPSPLSRRRRLIGLLAAAVAATSLAVPASAQAFGTVWNLLGQHSEHERITRLALQCGDNLQPPSCFQSVSLDNVAGKRGTWGAVGAPDNLVMHLNSDREYWHCDNADWVSAASHGLTEPYPRSRDQALSALRQCRAWGRSKFYDGSGTWSHPTATPSSGAIATASQLIKSNGKVDSSNPGVGLFSSTCTYNGVQSKRAKCNVLEPFGYVLHMVEDFYSHTNWADYADPKQALSLDNPIGLGRTEIAEFFDMRRATPTDDEIPADFTGGCYPKKSCTNRVIHGESSSDHGINKDKGLIDTTTGKVTDPNTPRAQVVVDGVLNIQRAVDLAVLEAARQWEVLRSELAATYGSNKGAKMACALALDRSEQCDSLSLVLAVDTSSPKADGVRASQRTGAQTPTTRAAQRFLDRLDDDDSAAVVTFDRDVSHRDVDGFVKPSRARIDDARVGDPQRDPSVRVGRELPLAKDPTVTSRPDLPVGVQPPAGTYTHGSEDGGHASAAAVGRASTGAIGALDAAEALLVNSRTPRGQRGVAVVTTSAAKPRLLAKRIRALGGRGAVVSLALYGQSRVPGPVVRAVEATGGVALATRDAGTLRRFAAVADVSGLTRLDDPVPHHEATLALDHPTVHGTTDAGTDTHTIERHRRASTVRVDALGAAVQVVATDRSTGTVRRATARRDKPARIALRARGKYEIAVEGKSGRHYRIGLSRR